jgi:hypothetical protein
MVLGTVGYMSPEQVRGKAAEPASDIFALGVVLYEMLAGRAPFRRDTGPETMAAILHEDPPPLGDLGSGVPAGIEAIVSRCLEKEPGERFQSARDLAFNLRAVSSGGVPTAQAAGTLRRWRFPIMAAALVAAATAVGLWTLQTGDSEPPDGGRNPKAMVAPFENRTGAPELDALGMMVTDWVTRGLAQTGCVEVVPAMSVGQALQAQIPMLEFAAKAQATLLVTGAYYLEGEILRFEGEINELTSLSLVHSLEPVVGPRQEPAEVVRSLREQIMGAVALHFGLNMGDFDLAHVSKAPSFDAYQDWLAGVQLMSEDPQQAMAHIHRAAELDPDFVPVWFSIIDGHTNQGEYAEADAILDRLEQRFEQMTPYEVLAIKLKRARLEGRYEEALVLARQLEAISPADLHTNFWLVWAAATTNRPQEAADAYERLDTSGFERDWFNLARAVWYGFSLHSLGR